MTVINERYQPHERRPYDYPPDQQVCRRLILGNASGLYIVPDHGPSFRGNFD